MKILIGIIVLAVIYFIYKKMTGDNASSQSSLSDSTSSSTTAATPDSTSASAASDTNDGAAEQLATAAAGVAAAACSTAPETTIINNPLPLEHLLGVDRRAGKALRALGITDMNALISAGADKLEAAGFAAAAGKTLQAQARLSALSGVTPHEASILANCGVDSVSALAQQSPGDLLARVARSNRATGALKSAPGVQQLQRLINSANAAI